MNKVKLDCGKAMAAGCSRAIAAGFGKAVAAGVGKAVAAGVGKAVAAGVGKAVAAGVLFASALAQAATTYYVSATGGDDANDGLSQDAPLKTLARFVGDDGSENLKGPSHHRLRGFRLDAVQQHGDGERRLLRLVSRQQRGLRRLRIAGNVASREGGGVYSFSMHSGTVRSTFVTGSRAPDGAATYAGASEHDPDDAPVLRAHRRCAPTTGTWQ